MFIILTNTDIIQQNLTQDTVSLHKFNLQNSNDFSQHHFQIISWKNINFFNKTCV